MGQLINGQWTKSSVITSDKSGAFVRKERVTLDIGFRKRKILNLKVIVIISM